MMTNVRKQLTAAFTLTEILIAMFILSMGILGIMSLFPVGLDATNRAINNQVVYLAGQTAAAQVNCMVNVSEIFDYRNRQPCFRVYNATATSISFDATYPWASGGSQLQWQQPFAGSVSRNGYYLRMTSGSWAGQFAKITSTGSNSIGVTWLTLGLSTPPEPGSTFVVTKWALPRTPGSPRAARVVSAGGSSITAKRPDCPENLTWSPNWTPGEFNPPSVAVDGRYFVVFTSGMAKGKVVLLMSNTENTLSVTPGAFSATESSTDWFSSRVRLNDTFLILGTNEVDSVYPFGGLPDGRVSAGSDATLPFGAARRNVADPAAVPACPYSYAIILSDPVDMNPPSTTGTRLAPIPIPFDAFDPAGTRRERAAPQAARVDVLVFLNYDYSLSVQDQSPLSLIGISSASVASFF